MHIAAKRGAFHLIENLCSHIDVDAENNRRQSPLHVAIELGQDQFVLGLIQQGANLNRPVPIDGVASFSLNALGFAVMRGERACIDQLIKSQRVNLRSTYPGLGSLLHVAIYFHQFDTLDYLLGEHKPLFDIESRNHDDLTPLSFAASLGEQECIGLLYHHGASVEVKDFNESTPLHHAAIGCHYDTIQLLASLGSKINPVDHNHDRPVDLVRKLPGDLAKSCTTLFIHLSKSKASRNLQPIPHLLPPSNLVFRGGGPKGLAFVGALAALHEEKLLQTIDRVAGTSAGAITAALVAINYPIDKLENLLMTTNLVTLLLDHPLSNERLTHATADIANVLKILSSMLEACLNPLKLVAAPFKALYKCTGLCEGEKFRGWLENLIAEETGVPFLTFGQLAQLIKEGKPYKHLHVYGTRVGNNPKIIHIHSNDPEWKDVIISDAVRLSMSIPGVFKPHIIHIKSNGERIPAPQFGSFLDGGMLYNFPIETFDQKQFLTREELGKEAQCPKYNKRTIGLSLYSSLDNVPIHPNNITNIGQLLLGVCNLYINAEEKIRQLNPYNTSRVIEIDVKDIGTLSFDMSDTKKAELLNSGKRATKGFLQNHHLIQLPRLTLPTVEKVAFGPSIWEKYFGPIDQAPLLPKNLQALLRSSCPFWPRKKIYETHILALIPRLTLGQFIERMRFENRPLFKPFEIEFEHQVEKPYWILMSRNTLPNCYKMTYEERCQLIAQYPDYRPCKLIEAAICTGLEALVHRQTLFSDSAPSWMRWTQCEEKSNGDPICVGNVDKDGIGIFTYPGKRYGGVVAVRRL